HICFGDEITPARIDGASGRAARGVERVIDDANDVFNAGAPRERARGLCRRRDIACAMAGLRCEGHTLRKMTAVQNGEIAEAARSRRADAAGIAEREAGSAPQVRLTIARETPDRRRDATRIGAFDEPQRAPNAGIECVQIPAWRHSSPHVLLRMKERLMKSVAIESERR